MGHVKTLCYSCVFYSQKRVALTAATILYKMTCYISKSVDIASAPIAFGTS